MEREERQHAKGVADEVSGWMKRAAKLVAGRHKLAGEAEKASAQLTQRLVPLGPNGQVQWRTLNLTQGDGDLVTAMARAQALPELTSETQRVLNELAAEHVAKALITAKALHGARRMFSGKDRQNSAAEAATYLTAFHNWVGASGFLAAVPTSSLSRSVGTSASSARSNPTASASVVATIARARKAGARQRSPGR